MQIEMKKESIDKAVIKAAKFLQKNHDLITGFFAGSKKYRSFAIDLTKHENATQIVADVSTYEDGDTHHYIKKLTRTELKRIIKEIKNETR